jgi:diguanylate cyclase (GGDEF)-like protein
VEFATWLSYKSGHFGRQKINLAMVGAALLLASVVLIVAEYVILRASLINQLDVQAKIIGANSAAAMLFSDRNAAKEILNTLEASPSIDLAVLYTTSGKIFVEYRREGVSKDSILPLAPQPQFQRLSFTSAELSQIVGIENNNVGTIYVRSNLHQLYIHLLWYIGISVFVIIAIIGASALLLRRLQGVIVHAEERMGYLAYYDTITSLPNRHAFNERFATMLQEGHDEGHKLALLFLDLDDFKVVNDTLGHSIGDMLLKAVAERLLTCVRQGDVVCRVGGDEFAMILTDDKTMDAAATVAEKFIRALMTPFNIADHNLYVGASIGISAFPQDGQDVSTLLRNADAAMYFAKARGKNNYQLFSGEMHKETMHRLALEGDLRNALERGEFELRYQPIIELSTGRIVAAEALLRWCHPEKGVISPDNFIPLAEETGLITTIGEWVLRTACMDAQVWQAVNNGMQVSVNLSGRQFQEDHLIASISSILEETGLNPQLLTLEITESVLMKHAEVTISSLRRLQEMGISLSIDDFGTGYSSMTYLKRFPVAKLKIDQSFVRDIPHDTDDVAIVMATIRMAHGLKLEIVAEGVETREQAEFLYKNGCDLVQGFLFSRPVEHSELLEICKTNLQKPPYKWYEWVLESS